MEHILLIAGRKTTLDSLSEMVRSFGYTLSVARNQRAGIRLARRTAPDLIILDNTVRQVDPHWSRHLRSFCDTPLLAIVRSEQELRYLGCTHHLVKPYSGQQLHAEVCRALQYPRYLVRGPLRLDLRQRCVSARPHCEPQVLPPKQFVLLRLLMLHHGTTISRQDLMTEVWDTEFIDDTRTLDVHVRWVREKIEQNPSDPKWLLTVRGVGYCLDCEA